MAAVLGGWGYADSSIPEPGDRPLSPLRRRADGRPAHARVHVWTQADDDWLRANAGQHSRLDMMMRFDCDPEELTRHLVTVGVHAKLGRPLGRRDGAGVVRRPRKRPEREDEGNNVSD